MSRRAWTIALVLAAAVFVVALLVGRSAGLGRRSDAERSASPAGTAVAADALNRLWSVPFYRGLLRTEAVRSASFDAAGAIDATIDVPALLAPRLADHPIAGVCDLLPRSARGRVLVTDAPRAGSIVASESWVFDGPAPVLDVLDRRAASLAGSAVWGSVPRGPSAVASFRLDRTRLADPALGGEALAPWRERIEIAEKVLGRPLRAEIAEDLAGPGLFALYDAGTDGDASALLLLELGRTDRLRGLLDAFFALGALSERATVRRHRDVPIGSFRPAARGPEIAIAIDGPLFLAATSRPLLESAIDARRASVREPFPFDEVRASTASWTAAASSPFVEHGWLKLARAREAATPATGVHIARLVADGRDGWRLEGTGPNPALTADPVLPFLRRVWGGAQRGAG